MSQKAYLGVVLCSPSAPRKLGRGPGTRRRSPSFGPRGRGPQRRALPTPSPRERTTADTRGRGHRGAGAQAAGCGLGTWRSAGPSRGWVLRARGPSASVQAAGAQRGGTLRLVGGRASATCVSPPGLPVLSGMSSQPLRTVVEIFVCVHRRGGGMVAFKEGASLSFPQIIGRCVWASGLGGREGRACGCVHRACTCHWRGSTRVHGREARF